MPSSNAAEQERGERLALHVRPAIAADDEFLAAQAFDLEPVLAAPGDVGPVGPLGHDAFESCRAGLRKELLARALHVIGIDEKVRYALGRQQFGKLRAAFFQLLLAPVLAVERQEIEGEIADRRVRRVDMLLQRFEIGDAGRQHEGSLAVDQRDVRRQAEQRLGDGRKAHRPVEPAAAEQGDVVAGFARDDAVAVILHLVQPAFARPAPRCRAWRAQARRIAGISARATFFALVLPPSWALPLPRTLSRRWSFFLSLVGAPDGRVAVQDLVHGPAALHAGVECLGRLVALAGIVVALLDQQPVLPAAIFFARLHAHQHVIAVQPVAVQAKFEIALGETLVGVADRLPGAFVPDHHRAAAIFAFGDHPFEAAIFERMVLGHHRQTLLRRVEARAARDGPALQHAVMLEPEIEMGAPRRMLLDDEAVALGLAALRSRLGRLAEVALRLVLGKQVSASKPAPWLRLTSVWLRPWPPSCRCSTWLWPRRAWRQSWRPRRPSLAARSSSGRP